VRLQPVLQLMIARVPGDAITAIDGEML